MAFVRRPHQWIVGGDTGEPSSTLSNNTQYEGDRRRFLGTVLPLSIAHLVTDIYLPVITGSDHGNRPPEDHPASCKSTRIFPPAILFSISSLRPVSLLFTSSTFRAWAVFSAIAFFPPLLISRGLDIFTANLFITLMLFAGVAGQLIGGALADNYGKKTIAGKSDLFGAIQGPLPPFGGSCVVDRLFRS